MKINVFTLIAVYGKGDRFCMSSNLACMVCLYTFDMQIQFQF